MPSNMQSEETARKLIAANPNSDLLKWIGALLPLARGLIGKLVLRWATIGGTAVIAGAEHTGYAIDVSDGAKITGAIVLLATFAADWLVTFISSKLHAVPKALPVE